MEQNDKREVTEALQEFLDEYLIRMIISNPVEKQGMSKVKIRPLKQKDLLLFQAEELVGNQAFHKKNLTKRNVQTMLQIYWLEPFVSWNWNQQKARSGF
ncbi:hypothetical protein [Lacrimispora xylanisolvens]|uniref:hypothetical protein n=1 Tax=Lacrimispora xylanisolvens TaxID=384636 RepID=UPI0032E80061